MLVYKAQNGLGPKYISDLLILIALRSSGTGLLKVPELGLNKEKQLSVFTCQISGTNSQKT